MKFKFDYENSKRTGTGTKTTYRFYLKEGDGDENHNITFNFWGALPGWARDLGLENMSDGDTIEVSFDAKYTQKKLDEE